MEIPNACVIFALRKLLEDPTWGPDAIVEKILRHDGFPSEDNKILEQYAPVQVWDERSTISGNDDFISIPNGDGSQSVTISFHDKIVVNYDTRPGRGHMVCIRAGDIFKFKRNIRGVITRKI